MIGGATCLFPMRKALVGFSILLVVTALAPLWLMPIDFWDGRIIDYAMTTGDLRGLKMWFFENRFILQYWFYAGVHNLAELTGISHRVWFAASASIAILGIAAETTCYGRGVLRLPQRYAVLAGYLALFFPPWDTLTSSDLLVHGLCVWWLLLGYRLSKSRHVPRRSLGVVCILVSFQLNSLPALLAGLCAADCLLAFRRDRSVAIDTWRRCAFVIGVTFIAFAIFKLGFPPYGGYEGYNRIVAFDSFSNMDRALRLLGRYCVWPVAVAGLACVGVLMAIGTAALDRRIQGLPLFLMRDVFREVGRACARDYGALLAILLLFFAGVAPYVVVLKYAKFVEFNDWSQRNAYVLCLPLSLLGACLARLLAESLRESVPTARYAVMIPMACLCGFASFLYGGYSQKIERASFELSVIQALKALPPPPAGAVFVRYDHMRGVAVRMYESNWLLWRAYGRLDWISAMGEHGTAQEIRLAESTQRAMDDGGEERRLEEMAPDLRTAYCHSDILLEGNRLTERRAWKWILGLRPLPEIKAAVAHSSCGGSAVENVGS